MSGIVNPGAGYCQVEVGPDSRRCLKSHPCPEHDPLPGPEWRKRNAMSSVPRRAVFDDLREGQWVAWESDLPQAGIVTRKSIRALTINDEGREFVYVRGDVDDLGIVVLRDAPAPPVTVPRELIDALAEQLDRVVDDSLTKTVHPLVLAARAVVDHASEGNPT